MQEGTLAGAVFPYDAEIVACQELKVEVLENGSSIVAGTEILTSELSHKPTSLAQCFFQHGKVFLQSAS